MTAIYFAEYSTSHFDFTTIGATDRSARASLVKGLRQHGKQYDLPSNWYRVGMSAAEFLDEITVLQMWHGVPLRDGSQIKMGA